MNDKTGTIYLRDNEWFQSRNVIKMGVSSSIKDRDNTYITGEPVAGTYVYVIEVELEQMGFLDNILKDYFQKYNIYENGGTEFYDRTIIDLIIPFLDTLNIQYRILSKDEIELITRRVREKGQTRSIQPNQLQENILSIIPNYFNKNNIGKLIWACGLGKALLGIFIVKQLKFKTVLIGVPSINLQKQMKNEILKVFTNPKNILLIGGKDRDYQHLGMNKNDIIHFITNHESHPKFVISTYHSCYLLVEPEIIFQFKIGDEAHHLVGVEREENKGFRIFHKIQSLKTLFMTATEKVIETRATRQIYSMNDENVFGKLIDLKTVHWAIETKKITDYNILVLKNTEDEVDEIVAKLRLNVINKEIFISCYMSLKSFEKYSNLTHLLLYTNTTEHAELCSKYINDILSLNVISIPKEKIYNNAVHSKNCNDLNKETDEFKRSVYGILSCVYIFGEGFDLPELNGVCIAGNMQSETRIVQYLLRPNRLNPRQPNKKAYVIIPYIDTEDWETENKSYEKVRNIISQMRNVDEKIEQKIRVCISRKIKEKTKKNESCDNIHYYDYIFEENSDELNRIKLRLRYSKALKSKYSEEEDEYNYVRSINKRLNIQSRIEYFTTKHIHENYIESPEQYFKSNNVWKSWYHFIGLDTSNFIQCKDDWIKFCKTKNIRTEEDYKKVCDKHDFLPKEPNEFYKNFTNILFELDIKITTKRR